MKKLLSTVILFSAILFFVMASVGAGFSLRTRCMMNRSRRLNPAAIDSTKVRHSETEGKAYKVRAIVKQIYRKEMKITLKHEKITGYMPAMTMTFPISKASLFNNVEVGSKGIFTIFVYKGLPTVTSVKLSSPRKSNPSNKK